MITASYSNIVRKSILSRVGEDYPFVFQAGYSDFLRKRLKSNLIFIISECDRILIPVRIYKIKIFSFAQILHPPLKEFRRLAKEEEGDFLNRLAMFMKKNRLCQRIVQPPNYAIFRSFPEGSRHCRFATYSLDLQNCSEEELFMRLKNRTEIRNAINKGITVEWGQLQLPVFYELYQQTMKRANMSCEPFSFFEDFYACLGEGMVICAVSYHKGSAQGALFMPYTKYGAYYLYGASAGHISVNGAVDYAHWQAIKLLKKKGVRRYDFVGARLSDISGTRLEGIQHFKAKFGCELEEGYLWKMDFSRFYTALFDSLVRVKLTIKRQSVPRDLIEQELMALKTKNEG